MKIVTHIALFLFRSFILSAFFLSKSNAQNNLEFSVKTSDNHSIDLSKAITQNKATVFVFLMPDCPLCEYYTASLKKLQKQYAPKKIYFYVVFAGTLFSKKEIDLFLTQNKMNFTTIYDNEKRLARILGATVTPQAVIISSNFKRLYTGKIDNWMTADRQHRTTVTDFYLSDALRNIVANKSVAITYTEPIGCFIP
ncbi:MAG: hypothetical protein RI894_330 [Bacteroidota bacterium]|jgi:thiol-disulfide isomerase/thioredoxin